MHDIMPQELEVRYILPAVRRELAKILIKEHKLSQKETARLLGLTEAAVSQYIHSKRGNEVAFTNDVVREIKQSASNILKDKTHKRVMAEIYRISNLTKVKHILCDMHRSHSKELANCNICFEDANLIQIKAK